MFKYAKVLQIIYLLYYCQNSLGVLHYSYQPLPFMPLYGKFSSSIEK
jgi:hypothetical protein